jgi:hypothetical protein
MSHTNFHFFAFKSLMFSMFYALLNIVPGNLEFRWLNMIK